VRLRWSRLWWMRLRLRRAVLLASAVEGTSSKTSCPARGRETHDAKQHDKCGTYWERRTHGGRGASGQTHAGQPAPATRRILPCARHPCLVEPGERLASPLLQASMEALPLRVKIKDCCSTDRYRNRRPADPECSVAEIPASSHRAIEGPEASPRVWRVGSGSGS
jgi:hypothetical protein